MTDASRTNSDVNFFNERNWKIKRITKKLAGIPKTRMGRPTVPFKFCAIERRV